MDSRIWNYDKKVAAERIATILNKRGAKAALARSLNRPQSAATPWKKGEGLTPQVLCAIAEYSDRSVDWLLGREAFREGDIIDPRDQKKRELVVELKMLLPELDEIAVDNIRVAIEFWKEKIKERKEEC